MAEIAICRPLWEAEGQVSALKAQTRPYPERLKKAVIEKLFWESDFSLRIARKGVERADVAYAAGCCFRCVACILQVLFALNEQYWLNEKGAVALADTFPVRPEHLRSRIERAFTLLAADRPSLEAAIAALEEVQHDMDRLVTR